MRVLVIGGTGFIGRHLIARLVEAGHTILVPTRRYQNGRDLLVFPPLHLIEADVHDDAALTRLLGEADAVINLAGVLHSRPGMPYGPDFAQVHVELPRRIAQICRELDVRRFLHVSALGASTNGSSQYLRSKAAGEMAIVDEFRPFPEGAYTLFRPSVIFGPDDNFMNMFARLARWLPIIPLAGASSRLQPVYVGDVVHAMAGALGNWQTFGKTYELVGFGQYTLAELVQLAAQWSGYPRPVLPLPMWIGRIQARFFECLPGTPLLTRDNLDSLKTDNISTLPLAPVLGVVPTPLESKAPFYLSGTRGRLTSA